MFRKSKSLGLVSVVFLAGALAIGSGTLTAQRSGEAIGQASPFGALQWRSIGPQRGGRSIAVAGSAARPNEYYFGATGGGLWKTTDGGDTWAPVTDGQIYERRRSARSPSRRVEPRHRLHRHGRVVHPRQHHPGRRRLQVDRRRQDLDARRLRRDADASRKIRIHPTNPDIVFVAALRPLRPARTTSAASSRATDGGKTWQKVLFRDDKTGAIDIAIDPQQPERAVRGAVGGVPRRRT